MGVCPKCRRLYERDRQKLELMDSVPKLTADEVEQLEADLRSGPETIADRVKEARLDEALTAAERQKRFREKDREGYRRRNRERMRRKRAE